MNGVLQIEMCGYNGNGIWSSQFIAVTTRRPSNDPGDDTVTSCHLSPHIAPFFPFVTLITMAYALKSFAEALRSPRLWCHLQAVGLVLLMCSQYRYGGLAQIGFPQEYN